MKNSKIRFISGIFVIVLILTGCQIETNPVSNKWIILPNDFKCSECNIIFITADALRADHLGSYGYPLNTTPSIDTFAQDSVIFTNSVSQSGTTLWSLPSLFKSILPTEIDSRSSSKSFVEILQEKGYYTAAILGHEYYKKVFYEVKGFDFEDDNSPIKRNATILTNSVIGWLNDTPKPPFFLWVHYLEPHMPYKPPKSFFEKFYNKSHDELTFLDVSPCGMCIENFTRAHDILKENLTEVEYQVYGKKVGLTDRELAQIKALYDANIYYLDMNLGRLFKYLKASGLLENTIIIFSSDHAEMMGEKKIIDHNELYYDGIHVPLIIRHPKLGKKIIDNPVSLLNIYPTILEIADIEYDPSLIKGRSLFLNTKNIQIATYHPDHYTIIIDNWKLLRKDGEDLLFNLEEDPEENNNLANKKPRIIEQLKAIAIKYINKDKT